MEQHTGPDNRSWTVALVAAFATLPPLGGLCGIVAAGFGGNPSDPKAPVLESIFTGLSFALLLILAVMIVNLSLVPGWLWSKEPVNPRMLARRAATVFEGWAVLIITVPTVYVAGLLVVQQFVPQLEDALPAVIGLMLASVLAGFLFAYVAAETERGDTRSSVPRVGAATHRLGGIVGVSILFVGVAILFTKSEHRGHLPVAGALILAAAGTPHFLLMAWEAARARHALPRLRVLALRGLGLGTVLTGVLVVLLS